MLGTTGEATSFSLEERKRVMDAYKAAGLPLDRMMVGTGAAARAGLKFVVFTDHGDATRPPNPPTYRSGVLCLDGVEVSILRDQAAAVALFLAGGLDALSIASTDVKRARDRRQDAPQAHRIEP